MACEACGAAHSASVNSRDSQRARHATPAATAPADRRSSSLRPSVTDFARDGARYAAAEQTHRAWTHAASSFAALSGIPNLDDADDLFGDRSAYRALGSDARTHGSAAFASAGTGAISFRFRSGIRVKLETRRRLHGRSIARVVGASSPSWCGLIRVHGRGASFPSRDLAASLPPVAATVKRDDRKSRSGTTKGEQLE